MEMMSVKILKNKINFELISMKNKIKIIPAVIAKSQKELDEQINKVKDFVELIQIDIMDGKFVPNSSIDFDFTIPSSNCKFEAHLMITNPLEWIENHWETVDTILVHFEATNDPDEIIELARKNNKRVGFALNPETSVEKIKKYLDEIDEILIMTVTPGFYGSKFLPEALQKVEDLRNLKPDLDIEVDGGITDETIKQAYLAGANMFVSGSFIVKSENIKKAIDTLKDQVN